MSEQQTANDQEQVDDVMGADAGQASSATNHDEVEKPEANETAEASESTEAKAELSEEQKIAQLEELVAKAQEDVLRAQAEAQNARRRSDTDVEKARKFALERFVGDLLPVVDNLDRALDAMDTEDESLKTAIEGIELTRKSFLDTLSKNHVVQIDPAGEPFDPETHQAMTMVPNPDLEPNTVMDVFQKGYSLHGRLIRPAMVVVSKAAE